MQIIRRIQALVGRGPLLAASVLAGVALAVAVLGFGFNPAPPGALTIAAGPDGSTFRRTAERYRKILAREGVQVLILPSEGSVDNLRKLLDPKARVDVGFVLGGEASEADADKLVSLGSVSYQPLMIFYRGAPRKLLSDFKGRRLDIGAEGSGTNHLAQALLAANGVKAGDGTTFVDTAAADTVTSLKAGRIDAFFAMSDSTPTTLIRELLRTPGLHLFDFEQSESYSRRFAYLNKLTLPRGGIDLGEDIPAEDLRLVGPTVELVARESLHPAISDLLLEAAREVHGRPGLYKKRGEFPAPLEHEFRISPDAARFYATGKTFLYRTFPFWVASLIARTAAVLVPVILLLVPAIRLLPVVYRWRVTSRIYRWYGALQKLEHDGLAADAPRREELLARLDHIEQAVMRTSVPAAFGDLFYGLRGHIAQVRAGLTAAARQEASDPRGGYRSA